MQRGVQMTGLNQGAWVMVADGEKALFLVNRTDSQDPFLELVRQEEHESAPSHLQGADRPGRAMDSGPGQRSALQSTDWHQLDKERFADDMADLLYRCAHRGDFEELVIVAPAKTLGELRRKLHSEVAKRLVHEIDKTLTNHPVPEIEGIVKAELDGRG